jgi:hypothetical protein
MLDLFDFVGVRGAIIEIGKDLLQHERAFPHVRRHTIEHLEILVFPWQ